MTRAELAPMAEAMMAMGKSGDELTKSLTALASVKAIGISGGVETLESILKKVSGGAKISSKSLADLYKTGVNVNEVAGKMGVTVAQLQAGLKAGTVDSKKFGAALQDAIIAKGQGPLASMASSLTVQWAQFKENIGKMFEGVDVKPFLDGMKSLLSVFGQSSASGKAMKAGITGVLNGVFSVAAKVLPFIRRGIEYLIIGVLKMYIAIKQHWGQIAPILKVVGVGFGLVTAAIGVVVAAGVGFVGMIAAIPIALGAAVAALVGFAAKGIAALADWAKSGITAASDFVNGLIDGITGGIGRAVGAVKNLGSSVLASIRNVLESHSPSRKMMEIGAFASKGFAQGIAAGNDNVMAAGANLGGAALGGAVAGQPVPANSGGGGGNITINVGDINVDGAGASNPQELADKLQEAIVSAFEKLALTQGLGAVA